VSPHAWCASATGSRGASRAHGGNGRQLGGPQPRCAGARESTPRDTTCAQRCRATPTALAPPRAPSAT
jgi:hypothetical protein